MLSLSKIGQGLRWFGEKVATGASWLGHKVGGALTSLSPAVAAFNPSVGAGMASAGMVAKGIGAIGDMGKAALSGGQVDTGALRQTVGQIRSDAGKVKQAYQAVRGQGNPLERG
jgi:hypothetical protein